MKFHYVLFVFLNPQFFAYNQKKTIILIPGSITNHVFINAIEIKKASDDEEINNIQLI